MKFRQNRKRQKGISLVVTIAGLVWVIMPMLGLVVDLGILYSAKSRLQAAVDGAALAAARALTLGSTTAAQALSAQQNAVNWFYANFPSSSNWNTNNTSMSTGTVSVAEDNSNYVRTVTVTATTTVPAWFMAYFGFKGTTLSLTGQASRKDMVAMIVLDRSGSMCSVNGAIPNGMPPCGENSAGTACAAMIQDAKSFTSFFAEGRDQIGLLSFSDGWYLESPPVTDFQSKLGSATNNGTLDNLTCNGGTGTAAAISMAYNELYKIAEPKAMNIIMLMTDGLPNTLAYNFYSTPGMTSTLALKSNSNCQDTSGKTPSTGWKTVASVPSWTTGVNMNNGSNPGFMSNVPSGAIGAFYTADPAQKAASGAYQIVLFNPVQGGDSSSNNSSFISTAAGKAGAGCAFSNAGSQDTNYADFAWLPSQDVFGNQVAPNNEYQSLALTGGHNVLTGPSAGNGFDLSNDWTATHAASLNATDNAAYNIRSNGTLPAFVFVIGLGGNNGDPPDAILLQRMANDPNGDTLNTSNPAFNTCSTEATCVNYPSQPQGTFYYAPSSSQLAQAFLAMASQILRLSQ